MFTFIVSIIIAWVLIKVVFSWTFASFILAFLAYRLLTSSNFFKGLKNGYKISNG